MVDQNIGAMYDAYLAQQVEDYMNSSCEGEPRVVRQEKEFEGYDEEGNIEYSTNNIYNCEECDNDECEYWKEFHSERED